MRLTARGGPTSLGAERALKFPERAPDRIQSPPARLFLRHSAGSLATASAPPLTARPPYREVIEIGRATGVTVKERALEGSLGNDLGPGVSVFAHAQDPARIGRDLHGLAAELGIPVARLAAQVLRDDPEALFVFRRPETAAWLANAKQTIASDTAIVASDGIYRPGLMHPRGYGTFPRFLRLATREWGTLDLPTAIHMMTGRTAARHRVPDRGVLRAGAAADVVVFDPERVSESSTFEEPRRWPVGIRHVLVNGIPVVNGERVTGVRPGCVLVAAR